MPLNTLTRRLPGFRPLATCALIAAFTLPGVSVCSFAAEEGPPAPVKKAVAPRVIAKNPNQVKGDEITPAQKQAVDKGLAWLAKRLQENGSLNAGVAGGTFLNAPGLFTAATRQVELGMKITY